MPPSQKVGRRLPPPAPPFPTSLYVAVGVVKLCCNDYFQPQMFLSEVLDTPWLQ